MAIKVRYEKEGFDDKDNKYRAIIVNTGKVYPYSSKRQNERNRRRYGGNSKGPDYFNYEVREV